MSDFDSLWTGALRYRHVSRRLEPLVRAIYVDLSNDHGVMVLKSDLERLLSFLASDEGRTDANCCAVDRFFNKCKHLWSDLPLALPKILDDMSGTLHDAIYAPAIAHNFDSLPEQLLQRLRQIERM